MSFDPDLGFVLEEALDRRDGEVIPAHHNFGFVFYGGVFVEVGQLNGGHIGADGHGFGGEREIADAAVNVDVVEVRAVRADVLQPDGADVDVVLAGDVAVGGGMVFAVNGPAHELLGALFDEEGPFLPAGRDLLQGRGLADGAARRGRAGKIQRTGARHVDVAEAVLRTPDVKIGAAEGRVHAHADFVGAESVVRLYIDRLLEAVAALAVEIIVAALFLDLAGGVEGNEALLPGGVAEAIILVSFEAGVEFGEHGRRTVKGSVFPDLLPGGGVPCLAVVVDRGTAVVEELF